MPVGVIAAGVGAAGAIGGALISSSSSSKAAKATQQGADTATAEQQREYDQSRADLQPWLSTGSAALARLAKMYGLDSGPATMPASSVGGGQTGSPYYGTPVTAGGAGIDYGLNKNTLSGPYGTPENALQPGLYSPTGGSYADQLSTAANTAGGTGAPSSTDPNAEFWQSPDYQFRMQQGIGGVVAGEAAQGSLDSGATRKAEIAYSGKLASGEYNNYANRLAALAGVGQTAANTDAATGANTATNISNIAQNNANNQASSYLAQGQGYSGAISSLAGIGSGLITNLYSKPAYPTGFTLDGNF